MFLFQSFNITSMVDGVPEIDEEHVIALVKTTVQDDVVISAPFSGASINEAQQTTVVIIENNEKPNGVLQVRTRLRQSVEGVGKLQPLKQPCA